MNEHLKGMESLLRELGRQISEQVSTSIEKDSDFLHARGYRYAAVHTKENGQMVLLVDDDYSKLPPDYKRFVALHALHYSGLQTISPKRTLKIVFLADEYAAFRVTSVVAINALKAMFKANKSTNPNFCIDIPSRIKNLGGDTDDMILKLRGRNYTEAQLYRMILQDENR